MSFYKFIRPFIFMFPAETAHNLAIAALKYHLIPGAGQKRCNELETKIFGIDFPCPVGLAAGFDKNAEVLSSLLNLGFGFVEVGTCTPLPQNGNDKPRLFRLEEDEAIINRFGFNNCGAEQFVKNLKNNKNKGVIGANIGKNKTSNDAVSDYLTMLEKVYGLSDYITVNISSPNTPGLRDLQGKKELDKLLGAIIEKRASLPGKKIPILLKISPDTNNTERADIAEIALKYSIDGLIISNTTIHREGLHGENAGEQGGLSGRPLFNKSNEALREMYRLTLRQIPIIGVGGIFSGDDAYTKIKSGASLIQIYSAIIYQGFGIVPQINRRICELLRKDGFTNISQAVGVDVL